MELDIAGRRGNTEAVAGDVPASGLAGEIVRYCESLPDGKVKPVVVAWAEIRKLRGRCELSTFRKETLHPAVAPYKLVMETEPNRRETCLMNRQTAKYVRAKQEGRDED